MKRDYRSESGVCEEDSSNENQYILSVQVPEGTLSIGDTAEFTISQDAGPF